MIKTYIKKPVAVQAIIWTGDNEEEITSFISAHCCVTTEHTMKGIKKNLIIYTLEGYHCASVGDYIVKGIKGEFYPVKPDIMELTYAEVTE
jgi:hypothetical protein